MKKPVFAKLLDRIEGDVESSLRQAIEASAATDWKQVFVRFPKAISYCRNRWIHRDNSGIFLLSKTRLSGYHTELWTYGFSIWIEQLDDREPIETANPHQVYGDLQPGVVLILSDGTELFITYCQGGGFKRSNKEGESIGVRVSHGSDVCGLVR